MRYFHYKKNPHHCPTINVERLFSLLSSEDQARAAEEASSGKAPVIDLNNHNVFKCLGKGRLPHIPLIVKAKYFSKDAEKKIVEAGGACILTA